MSEEAVDCALDQLLTLENGVQVHLTGGEPFLNFPLLLYAARSAAARGIPCYCETNGGWALNEANATEQFRQLRDAGMAYVLISVSPFHLEYIPPTRTFTAINAAISGFGSDRVFVYQTQWLDFIRQFGDDRPVKLDRYAAVIGDNALGALLWQRYGLIPMGRAPYRLGRWARKQPAEAFAGQTCRWELLHSAHSHMDLYGNFIPGFCGGLSLGGWHALYDLRLQSGSESFPPLITILVNEGPYGLLRFAADRFGYSADAEGYAGACHLCVDVRRYLAMVGHFAELSPRQFYQRLDIA